ncbi:hypothetical protein NDU88_007194 [Pleurodeles waltl]|uniref:Yippee domain-containing protein n=1 Tax=Pleurodeles waltl TaxID=8319 RepID=A0AAV7LRC0_PLEWA|nr:hypothetical protein NDU88_007194 [Pleurodeles waltl]
MTRTVDVRAALFVRVFKDVCRTNLGVLSADMCSSAGSDPLERRSASGFLIFVGKSDYGRTFAITRVRALLIAEFIANGSFSRTTKYFNAAPVMALNAKAQVFTTFSLMRTRIAPNQLFLLWRLCGKCHTHSRTTTAFACIFQCFFCQRVQQSCNSSSASPELNEEPPAEMVKMTKSKTFQAYLPNCHRTYSCIHCRAHLANHDELISKSFQGSQGRAYLFNSVVNVGCGPAEERVLLTGLHAVADIYCENCKTTLGWKYEHAFESSQKYKEGKFIIELAHMIKDNGWE